MNTIRFMIVDDQQIIREGLAGMLSREPDLELVGVAENGQEAFAHGLLPKAGYGSDGSAYACYGRRAGHPREFARSDPR